jgi:hypothetical protein
VVIRTRKFIPSFQKAVDIIWKRVAPRLVTRETHRSIDIDIKDAAVRPLQFDVFYAALFKFRLDTQGLGFVASRAAEFNQYAHGISFAFLT